MKRNLLLIALGAALLSVNDAASSPAPPRGAFRTGSHVDRERPIKLNKGQVLKVDFKYKGNERAYVMVEGDHNPPQDLGLYIYDEHKNLVASDEGGDMLLAVWYPPREATYFIQIKMLHDDEEYNDIQVVFK